MSSLVRVVVLVDRYGGAIEYDLHTLAGLDLLDFFRHDLSWRKLLDLVDRLPAGSAYWAARADDDELAEDTLRELGGKLPKGGGPPPLSDMSLTNQLLMSVVDGLTVVRDRVERSAGGKPSEPKALPRPTMALGRAMAMLETLQVEDLVAEVYEAMGRSTTPTR